MHLRQIDLSISSCLVKQTIYLSTFSNTLFYFLKFSIYSLLHLNIIFHYLFNIYLFFILDVHKNRERVIRYFNWWRERGLNISVIKIHLERKSNFPCVESYDS